MAGRLDSQRERARAFAKFLWRRFLDDKCFETAGALSYTTLFAIVPLLAAVFAVLSVFPVFAALQDHVSEFIFRSFVPAIGRTVEEYLLQFAGNASRLTIVGILVLFVTVLLMMASIEDRFNRIWRVPARRNGSARLLLYWAALTLGPLLIALGIGASAWVYTQPLWRGAAKYGVLGLNLWGVLPFLITWVGLTVLYDVVPNRRVRWRDAVVGGLVVTILFQLARRGFVFYIGRFGNYQVIYGALAAIPIFLIWGYLSWVIVLFGAILTAALTTFEYRAEGELLPPDCEFVGLLRVLQQFVTAQRVGAGLRETELTGRERFLTADLMQRYLGDLRAAGLVRRSDGGEWVMARDLDSVRLDDLFRVGRYRLPSDALSLQRACRDLAPEARVALQRAEAALRGHLAMPLRTLFTAPDARSGPSSSRQEHPS
ncbi:MAG: YihY family inner membrane protein [Rhodanobacteraceae bacterium]